MSLFISKFINYFRTMTVRGWINWIIISVVLFALVSQCIENKRLNDLIEKEKKETVEPKKSPTVEEAEEIKREVDTAGREKVIYKMAEPIIERIVDNTKADSLANIANVRADKITSITTINAQLLAENKKLKESIDSKTGDTTWEYRDRWLTNVIRIKDTTSTVWVDASVNKIDYDYKKYWLFGENENRAVVWFNSPYIKPDGLETLTIRQKEKFFDIGVKASTQYLHSSKELFIGPKVDVRLGRFTVTGGYYLNPGGGIGNTIMYGGDYKLY